VQEWVPELKGLGQGRDRREERRVDRREEWERGLDRFLIQSVCAGLATKNSGHSLHSSALSPV
jgi:hypothetical protein